MRQGIVAANIGSYSDPHAVVEIAKRAELAGWESFLLWDHLGFVWEAPSCDPWVTLSAIAMSTEHLLLGTAVTPVARYRPQRLAATLSTISQLCRAGLVLGAGLGGVPGEFEAFGESADPGERAGRLDEALEVLSQFWTGEEVTHHGHYFTVDGVALAPVPPSRIPVWVGGNSRRALRRAARYDGWIADSTDAVEMWMEPDEFGHKVELIRQARPDGSRMDYVVMGYSQPDERELARSYELAGATWWLEAIHDIRGTVDEMTARVEAGPVDLKSD